MTGNFLIAASSPSSSLVLSGHARSQPVEAGFPMMRRFDWDGILGGHTPHRRPRSKDSDSNGAARAGKGKGRDNNPGSMPRPAKLKRARAECRPFTPSMSHCQSEEKGHIRRKRAP